MLHDPPVLVLDEPTDGLDPNQKHEVRRLIERMAPEKAILISTHILEEVDAVCSRAIIVSRGRIVADGTPAELQKMNPSGRLDDVFRDLTAARRYLGVYLMGARDATIGFADLYAQHRDPAARDKYEALLRDLEGNFASQSKALLANDQINLDIQIDVLRERLQQEGVRP